MSSSLQDFQKTFSSFVGEGDQDAKDSLLQDHLENTAAVSPENGLLIYTKNYVAALLSVLENAFPVTLIVLEENFKFFAREYIYQHPHRSETIALYGAQFSEFIASREELAQVEWLPDLAKLEWHFYIASMSQGRSLEKEQSLELDYDILKLWDHFSDEKRKSTPFSEDIKKQRSRLSFAFADHKVVIKNAYLLL